jgi:hypothetical protein
MVTVPVVVNPAIVCDAVPVRVTPPVVLVKVPLLAKFPESVNKKVLATNDAFKLIVNDAQLAGASRVTEFPAVVAITTSSPATGATPPTHVDPVAQTPPVVVLVMVAAESLTTKSKLKKRKIPVFNISDTFTCIYLIV